MINTVLDHIPFTEFITLVKQELKAYDSQGYVNDGDLIQKVMWCNERLGIPIHEVKQTIVTIENNIGVLPKDFYKVYYLSALTMTQTGVTNWTNPWDNSKDRTVTYDADYQRGVFAGDQQTRVVYKKSGQDIIQTYYNWNELELTSTKYAHKAYMRHPSKHKVEIEDGEMRTGFRTGEVYMMYVANMTNDEGEIMVPFHPLITPWYVWNCVEYVITNMIFDTDEDLNKLKMQKDLAVDEKNKAWINCWSFSNNKEFLQWQNEQRKKELDWYNKWFRIIN